MEVEYAELNGPVALKAGTVWHLAGTGGVARVRSDESAEGIRLSGTLDVLVSVLHQQASNIVDDLPSTPSSEIIDTVFGK